MFLKCKMLGLAVLSILAVVVPITLRAYRKRTTG